MAWTRRRKITASILALLLISFAAVYLVARQFMFDRYAGEPQVVGLPAGYDPHARTNPYTGPHPSTLGRTPDEYRYPVPIGQPGPVKPTYPHELEYPYACRTEAAGLGQPLIDNQDGAGTIVYAIDEAGEKTGRIAGYSRDCSLETRVFYRTRANRWMQRC